MRSVSGFKVPGILWLAYLFIEIFGFIVIGRFLGIMGALALLITTTLLGSYILKSVGVRSRLAINPILFMQNGKIFQVLAGFLLIVPGFVSDALGLILLIPFIQRLLTCKVVNIVPGSTSSAAKNKQPKGRIIEGECWHEDKKK